MLDVREVYDMVTKQKPPEPGALERQERRQIRAARNRKVGAFVAAGAIAIAAIAVALGIRSEQGTTTPAGDPLEASPTAPTAVEVATGFVEAFGDFDADRAIGYLAEDADLSGLDAGTVERLPLELSLLEAMGYEQILTSCQETGSTGTGTDVRCAFDFHGIRSAEIGLGPYSGSTFDLAVRDGKVVSVRLSWDIGEFSPQMWEPFAQWVSREYPRSGAVMYDPAYSNFALTEKSIRLWERRTKEYVETLGR